MKNSSSSQKFFLIVLLAYTLGLAVGPRVTEFTRAGQCFIERPFFGPFSVNLICDAPAWMNSALNPATLLEEGSTWQSRPGYPVLAHVILLPFKWLHEGLLSSMHEQDFLAYCPVLAYLFLNLVLLLQAARLSTLAIAGGENGGPAGWRRPCLFVLLLLFFNDVTKAFLWTPHTQMFNIFVPAFALFSLLRVAEARDPLPTSLWYALLAGLGTLFYGTFAVVVPAIAAGLFMHRPTASGHRSGPVRALTVLAAALPLYALPGAA